MINLFLFDIVPSQKNLGRSSWTLHDLWSGSPSRSCRDDIHGCRQYTYSQVVSRSTNHQPDCMWLSHQLPATLLWTWGIVLCDSWGLYLRLSVSLGIKSVCVYVLCQISAFLCYLQKKERFQIHIVDIDMCIFNWLTIKWNVIDILCGTKVQARSDHLGWNDLLKLKIKA